MYHSSVYVNPPPHCDGTICFSQRLREENTPDSSFDKWLWFIVRTGYVGKQNKIRDRQAQALLFALLFGGMRRHTYTRARTRARTHARYARVGLGREEEDDLLVRRKTTLSHLAVWAAACTRCRTKKNESTRVTAQLFFFFFLLGDGRAPAGRRRGKQ